MEIAHPPLATTLGADSKRHCIRIKARIKIQGEQEALEPAGECRSPYQPYCETVTSSRPQSPDVFTTPPTHSEPFHSTQIACVPTYTARIITRKVIGTSVSVIPSDLVSSETVAAPTGLSTPSKERHDQDVEIYREPLETDAVETNGHNAVSPSPTPRGSHSEHSTGVTSRNRSPSRSQIQRANISSRPTTQVVTTHTPLRQKRYGRMDYHPLPPLPPSPPDTPVSAAGEHQYPNNTTVNFSRGEISRRPVQQQVHAKVQYLPRSSAESSFRRLPQSVRDEVNLANTTPGHERPQSKASRRTVTFADDTTISSRSSSPDYHRHYQDRTLRQSKSFSTEAQNTTSLRLYRSHDSLLAASIIAENEARVQASRRTAPKDFQHRYAFGQRPASRIGPPPGLGQTSSLGYNPRLSTSKAQYRGLATLPRPMPSSLRLGESQIGPRQPPWGSLNNLEEQRERRIDARERDQVKQFRAATFSEATTLGSEDSFGREKMKKEVEEYKEQVMSVYPDLTFDGKAGEGGRRCCCAVM